MGAHTAPMTIRVHRCAVGYLAMWWDENRSAPYDVKYGETPLQAIARLDLEENVVA